MVGVKRRRCDPERHQVTDRTAGRDRWSAGASTPGDDPIRPAFSEIVVGVDFGAGGLAAIDLARRLVLAGGRVTLVHVVLIGGEIEWRADRYAFLAAQGRSMWLLDRERRLALVDDPDPVFRLSTHTIVAGSAARGLASVAQSLRADLIVIGQTHRRRWRPEVPAQLLRGPWVVALAGPDGSGTFR